MPKAAPRKAVKETNPHVLKRHQVRTVQTYAPSVMANRVQYYLGMSSMSQAENGALRPF